MATLIDHFPNAGCYAPQSLMKASGRGEGSRGGKIIGHTKSGKPVYAASTARYHHLRTGPGEHKPNDEVSLKDSRIVMGHYPGFTAQDHQDAAELHEEPNNHTAAAAHHLANLRLRLTGDETGQAAFNDMAGASAHMKYRISPAHEKQPKPPAQVIGKTPGGHSIHAATSDHYTGIGYVRGGGHGSVGGAWAYRQAKDKKNDSLMAERFGHFKLSDHDEATQAHLRHAEHLRFQGKERAANKAEDAASMHSFAAHRMRYPK